MGIVKMSVRGLRGPDSFHYLRFLVYLFFFNEEMEFVIFKTCLYSSDYIFKHTQIQNSVMVLPQAGFQIRFVKALIEGLPGGPVAKNPPPNAGGAGSIPGIRELSSHMLMLHN